jgi:cell division protein FtsQ
VKRIAAANNRQFDYTAGAGEDLRPLRGPQPVLDDADEKPYLHGSGRVPLRRNVIPRNRGGRILFGIAAFLVLAGLGAGGYFAMRFLTQDPHFRISSASSIQTTGNSLIERSELIDVFGGDIGRNIFYVSLRQRQRELEEIPWVEHAAVMRLLPDQLRVTVVERRPIAFVRRGSQIGLVDRAGVLLDMTPALMAQRHYSFPVVTGIEDKDPLSTRAARMQIYSRLMQELDSGATKLSDQLSEVDLSDPEDVRVLVSEQGSDVMVHLGGEQFLDRFNRYKAQLPEWRAKYPRLASVDMRYEQQAVLEMAQGTAVDPNQTEQAGTGAGGTDNSQVAPKTDGKAASAAPAAEPASRSHAGVIASQPSRAERAKDSAHSLSVAKSQPKKTVAARDAKSAHGKSIKNAKANAKLTAKKKQSAHLLTVSAQKTTSAQSADRREP